MRHLAPQGELARTGGDLAIFTYSSYSGEPSRMSLMAFDAGMHVVAGEDIHRLLLAPEQGRHDWPNTGTALLEARQPVLPLPIEVYDNPANRLINTPYQVEELAQQVSHDQRLTIVGWKFHRWRVQRLFGHYAPDMLTRYVTVESVFDPIWDEATDVAHQQELLREFRERYDLQVDWPTVKRRALRSFQLREVATSVPMLLGDSGWALKALSSIRPGGGRHDDIDENGRAIMKST